MKIICEKRDLVEAVTNIQRAVSTKSSVPALEGILLRASGETLFLCGYDLEIGMTTEIPARVREEGATVLSAKLFGDIVRRLPADSLELDVDEKDRATIRSGVSEFTIAGVMASEYPELPKIRGEWQFSAPAGALKSMIRQTLFAVADSDAKPIHTGTLFEIGGGVLRLVSVDGYRLAMREEAVQSDCHTDFVVPGKTLAEISRLLGDEGDVQLFVELRHIAFRAGGYTVISRLLEGEFLDYRAAIPPSHTSEAIVRTRAFTESVERVSLLITDRLKSPIRCQFLENEVQLSCSTPIGAASDAFPVEFTGNTLEIGFNNRYLLDALHNVETDEIRVQLGGPLNPMKILPKEGEAFLFLVLPVRLSSLN